MSETEGQADVPEPQVEHPDLIQLEAQYKNGANWFYWIAGLSIVNSAILLFSGDWSFFVGHLRLSW